MGSAIRGKNKNKQKEGIKIVKKLGMLLLNPSVEWRGERRVVGVLKIEPSASLGLTN